MRRYAIRDIGSCKLKLGGAKLAAGNVGTFGTLGTFGTSVVVFHR
jgi:hypothetical protein